LPLAEWLHTQQLFLLLLVPVADLREFQPG
jgi:hypothetical protein